MGDIRVVAGILDHHGMGGIRRDATVLDDEVDPPTVRQEALDHVRYGT